MFSPDKVLKQYARAIHKTANTYYFSNPRFSYEDLVAEAEIAAIQAIDTYDEDKGASFFTHLTSCMNGHVQKYVKNNRYDIKVTEYKQRKEFKEKGNLDDINKFADAFRIDGGPKDDNSERSSSGRSFLPPSGEISPDIAMIRVESVEILMQELDSLPDREKTVISDRWLEGKTLEQIATGFGVTKQTIHGWGKKGFERLCKRVKARLGDELVF